MDACRSFVCTEIQSFRALSSAAKHHKEPKNSCKSLLFCACGSEYNTHNKVQVTIKHNDRRLHWFLPTYVHEYQTVLALIYIYIYLKKSCFIVVHVFLHSTIIGCIPGRRRKGRFSSSLRACAPRGTNTPTLSNGELDSLVSKLMAGDQRRIVIYFILTYSDCSRLPMTAGWVFST